MQEQESSLICVGSLIICCNWNVGGITSTLEPSYVVLLQRNQRFDLALKSPRTTVKNLLSAVIMSIFNSKLFANDSKSSCDWLGERYKDTGQFNLPPSLISELMHSCKYRMFRIFKGRGFL